MIPTPHDLEPCPAECGELVLWTTTEHGHRMAVDATPDEVGNQAVFRNGPGGWRSRSLDGADARPPDPWEHRYKPHIATCPSRRPVQPTLIVLPGGRSRTRRRAPVRRYPWKTR